MQTLNREQDKQALSLLLNRIPVLPFKESDAKRFGVLRVAMRDGSRNAMDRRIAAHAVHSGLALATNNQANFQDDPGLVVENGAPIS